LIVDDSRAMRTILGRIIAPLGFEVTSAVHGRDALEQLAAGARPDLMLVDWNMPEMNGYELVQNLRADAAYAQIKIVMVTTESEIAQISAALAAGADEYVMKPFTSEAIVDKLRLLGLAAGE
jgi:two-component system chemotaxis response regulator CheY